MNSELTTQNSTNSPLILREFESCEVELPPEIYKVLRTRYAGRIDLAPTERPGVYRLSARDYVGRIGLPGDGLPGGLMLTIQPKVGVACLFYMLCTDAGLAEMHPPPANLAHTPDIFVFVVSALAGGIERLLSQGLYRTAVPHESDLPFVRGRIMLSNQLRRYGELSHRHVCAYVDATIDTSENRVVAATLRHLSVLLHRQRDVQLLKRIRGLLSRFEDVAIISRGAAAVLLRSISAHRLNASYAPVLALCRLILHNLTLDERSGLHPFASFLVEMPRLFERFVAVKLRQALPQYGLRVVAQRHDYLDEEHQIGIRPDVLVYARSSGSPLLVLDTKYRRLDDPDGDINRDLYQVSAYLDRYGLRQGVLVYPQLDRAEHTRLTLRGTPKHLHVTTLNLDAATPAELEQACANLAEQVAQLALM